MRFLKITCGILYISFAGGMLNSHADAADPVTINLRTEFNGNEWTEEVNALYVVQQKGLADALRKPENQKLAFDIAAQEFRISKETELVRTIAIDNAALSSFKKDEFETTAQFQAREKAAQVEVAQCQSKLDEIRREIVANDVTAKVEALSRTVVTPICIKIVTDTPGYDADHNIMSSKAYPGVQTKNLPPSNAPGDNSIRRYDNYKLVIEIQSKELPSSSDLVIENIPDVAAAKILKQVLSIGTGIPDQDVVWRGRDGLVMQGEAIVHHSQQTNEGGLAGAILMGGGRPSEETIHTFIIDFVKAPTLAIPEYRQDLAGTGVRCHLR